MAKRLPSARYLTREAPVAKPKTKLPKVWVYMRHGMVMRASTKHAKPLPDETAHQYAPLQPPRKCVWTLEDKYARTQCGELYPYGFPYRFNYSHCPNCAGKPDSGGRITRRSPR